MRPVALALLLLAAAAPAHAEDEALEGLSRAYEATLARHDPRIYREQERLLSAISDLRTDAAQERLYELLEEHGGADRMRAGPLLGALVRHGDGEDAAAAIRWVEQQRDPLLIEALSDVLAGMQSAAARKELREEILPALPPPVKAQVVTAIGRHGEPEGVFPILEAMRGANVDVRMEGLVALGVLGHGSSLPVVLVALRDEDPLIRRAAAEAAGRIGEGSAGPALRTLLDDENARVAEAAAGALGRLRDPAAIDDLVAALARVQDEDLRLAVAFGDALYEITGRALGRDAEIWGRWWEEARHEPFERAADADGDPKGGNRYYGFRITSSRICFVLDVSRSMGWNRRLKSAQAELMRAIDNLPAQTRFNVLAYSDDVTRWKRSLVPATGRNIESALGWVEDLDPVNGTNTHAALMRALSDRDVDTIYFLSDGNPSVLDPNGVVDTALIRADVRRVNRRRRVRIHTIAILRGDPPPAFAGREKPEDMARFMRELARENDGESRMVR